MITIIPEFPTRLGLGTGEWGGTICLIWLPFAVPSTSTDKSHQFWPIYWALNRCWKKNISMLVSPFQPSQSPQFFNPTGPLFSVSPSILQFLSKLFSALNVSFWIFRGEWQRKSDAAKPAKHSGGHWCIGALVFKIGESEFHPWCNMGTLAIGIQMLHRTRITVEKKQLGKFQLQLQQKGIQFPTLTHIYL